MNACHSVCHSTRQYQADGADAADMLTPSDLHKRTPWFVLILPRSSFQGGSTGSNPVGGAGTLPGQRGSGPPSGSGHRSRRRAELTGPDCARRGLVGRRRRGGQNGSATPHPARPGRRHPGGAVLRRRTPPSSASVPRKGLDGEAANDGLDLADPVVRDYSHPGVSRVRNLSKPAGPTARPALSRVRLPGRGQNRDHGPMC